MDSQRLSSLPISVSSLRMVDSVAASSATGAGRAPDGELDEQEQEQESRQTGHPGVNGEKTTSTSTTTRKRRSRSGCLVCRADKKGCDERHPRCGRCERLNISECVWPEPSLASKVAKKTAAAVKGSEDPARPPAASPTVTTVGLRSQGQSHVQPHATFASSTSFAAAAAGDLNRQPSNIAGVSGALSDLGQTALNVSQFSPFIRSPTSSSSSLLPYGSLTTSQTREERSVRSINELASETRIPASEIRPADLEQANQVDGASTTDNAPAWQPPGHSLASFDADYNLLLDSFNSGNVADKGNVNNFWDQLYLYDLDFLNPSTGGEASTSGVPYSVEGTEQTSGIRDGTSVHAFASSSHGSSVFNAAIEAPDNTNHTCAAEVTVPCRPERATLSRGRLDAIVARLPQKVLAVLQKIIDEQDGMDSSIPLPYLLNMSMWLPAKALRDLIDRFDLVYPANSPLRAVLEAFTDASTAMHTRNLHRSVKPKMSIAEICALPAIPLDIKSHALMDMAYKSFFDNGATGWYEALDAIGKYLGQTFHPSGLLNLASLGSVDTFGIANFAWADICRSIVLKQPTAFHYTFEPTKPSEVQMLTGTQYSNGSADVINCLIADISTLRFSMDRDLRSRPSTGNIAPTYELRASEIKQSLLEFRPFIPLGLEKEYEEDSSANIAAIAIQELWRQVAMIHYYKSIYQMPPSHPALQNALRQIFGLVRVIEVTRPIRLEAMLSLPMFLAATLALTDDDRKLCLSNLDKLGQVGGQAVAHQQNRAIIERTWRESDERGESIDWVGEEI